MALAATLASAETFDCFYGDTAALTLMHGHSYTANPLACAAALEGIRLLQNHYMKHVFVSSEAKEKNEDWPVVDFGDSFDDLDAREVSLLEGVRCCMTKGSVFYLQLKRPSTTVSAASIAVQLVEKLRIENIYARPLGDVIYIMVTPVSSNIERNRLIAVLKSCVQNLTFDSISKDQDVIVTC